MLRHRHHPCRGQAIAEVLIGIVALVVVFMAVFQFGLVGHTSLKATLAARAQADRNAQGNLVGVTNRNLLDWRDGADGLAHTADDEPVLLVLDDLSDYRGQLAAPVDLGQLDASRALGMRDEIAPVLSTNSLGVAAGLYGAEVTDRVPIEPTLHLMLGIRAQQIGIRESAAMPGLAL